MLSCVVRTCSKWNSFEFEKSTPSIDISCSLSFTLKEKTWLIQSIPFQVHWLESSNRQDSSVVYEHSEIISLNNISSEVKGKLIVVYQVGEREESLSQFSNKTIKKYMQM